MELDIKQLDLADTDNVMAALDVANAAVAMDVPGFPPRCRFAFQARFEPLTSYKREEGYLARANGVPVGVLLMELPLKENTENVFVQLNVHPDYRRQGVGRALYEHLAKRTRELGRKRLFAMTPKALAGGPERNPAGGIFAASLGAKDALEDVRRRLELAAVDEANLDKLLADAWPRATGYKMVSWVGATPEKYVADAAYLEGRLMTDAPMGDLTLDAEKIDASRLRESEAAIEKMRYRTYSAGMVHEATGRLVALTTIGRQYSTPEHAFQWITLVDPDHRGHRLGTIVKVENFRLAREHEPQMKVIDTWNATSNGYMISINEMMGFRAVEAWSNWELDI